MKINDLLESQRLININIANAKNKENSEEEKPVKRKPRKKAVVEPEDKDEE